MSDDPPATDRHTPHPEFVRWIAANGYTVELFHEHVRAVSGEECARCGKVWPCNMRQVAEQALRLQQGQSRS